MTSSAKWVIAVIVGIVGIVFLIAGIVYATVPIHSLPGFMPGSRPGLGTYHKKGLVTFLIGAVLLAVGLVVAVSARRSADTALPATGSTVPTPVSSGGSVEGTPSGPE
jgi:hypothetical protein